MTSGLLKPDFTEIVLTSQPECQQSTKNINWLLLPHTPADLPPSFPPLLQNIFWLFISPCLSFIEILSFRALLLLLSALSSSQAIWHLTWCWLINLLSFLKLDFILIDCFLTNSLGCPFNCQDSIQTPELFSFSHPYSVSFFLHLIILTDSHLVWNSNLLH